MIVHPSQHFIDLSPTSSQRSHASSLSYQHDSDMDFVNNTNMFYTVSTSHGGGPIMSYVPEEYHAFQQQQEHQQWMNLPLFSSSITATPPTTLFPTFDAPYPASGGHLAPQTVTPMFSFTSQPEYLTTPTHSNSYPQPQPRQPSHRYSHSSVSSLSRSSSPALTNSSIAPTLSNSSLSSGSNSLHSYGIPVHSSLPSAPQSWRCAYPGCTSRALFTRGCDLRKHFNRHSKHLYCRIEGCPQSEVSARRLSIDARGRSGSVSGGGGFSSKKDRARHEAKHNPGIRCEWRGENDEECERVFSRVDNMKDHVRRIHRKGQAAAATTGAAP